VVHAATRDALLIYGSPGSCRATFSSLPDAGMVSGRPRRDPTGSSSVDMITSGGRRTTRMPGGCTTSGFSLRRVFRRARRRGLEGSWAKRAGREVTLSRNSETAEKYSTVASGRTHGGGEAMKKPRYREEQVAYALMSRPAWPDTRETAVVVRSPTQMCRPTDDKPPALNRAVGHHVRS
jgi:hypothetical protein